MTFSCPEVKEAGGAFLRATATRYKGHPGLLGYDCWNECNYSPLVDFSEYTQATFCIWLQNKYDALDDLAKAWYRYSYANWDDIHAPRQIAPYPERLDWLQFKRDDFYAQMQFRIDGVRNADPDCMIVAHGVGGAMTDMASQLAKWTNAPEQSAVT